MGHGPQPSCPAGAWLRAWGWSDGGFPVVEVRPVALDLLPGRRPARLDLGFARGGFLKEPVDPAGIVAAA